MSCKWILVNLAVLLCVGLGTSLRCYLCTYEKKAGQEVAGSKEGCKQGNFDTNTVDQECTSSDESCFVQYTKSADDTYKWSRGCQASCTNSTANDPWLRCCDDKDLCNDADFDPGDDDDDNDKSDSEEADLEQCYSCTYSEENGQAVTGGGATNHAGCKRDDVTRDQTVLKAACTTSCVFEFMTVDNVTMWERGCRENCTTVKPDTAGSNYTICCTNNLCNGDMNALTSGCDEINCVKSFLFATMVLAALAWWKF